MNNKGLLIVYSGPSGVGKGTLLAPYLYSHPNAALSISMTTRAPRPGETDGKEYYFVSRETFLQKIEEDGLLEYAEYSGNFYGTPRAMVEEKIRCGCDVFLEIEVQGAMKIKETFPEAVFIFVMPPSYEVLCKRLAGRGTETPEAIAARLEAAQRELRYADRYDYIIINDTLEEASAALDAVITAAKCETGRMRNFVEKVCEAL